MNQKAQSDVFILHHHKVNMLIMIAFLWQVETASIGMTFMLGRTAP